MGFSGFSRGSSERGRMLRRGAPFSGWLQFRVQELFRLREFRVSGLAFEKMFLERLL